MSLLWKILVFNEGTESADITMNENILLLDEYSKVKLFKYLLHWRFPKVVPMEAIVIRTRYDEGTESAEVATGNVDQTFCPKLLSTKWTFDLFFLISVTYNYNSHIKYVHICEDCNSKFVEMHVHVDAYNLSNCLFTYRHVFTNVNTYPIKI